MSIYIHVGGARAREYPVTLILFSEKKIPQQNILYETL